MIGIRIDVQIEDFKNPIMPASEWMFPPVQSFWRKAVVFSPYWTGALRSSVAMEEDPQGAGWDVTAGDPAIINPITGTPTSEYAPIQEELKGFMFEAYQISGVRQKLDDAASRRLQ